MTYFELQGDITYAEVDESSLKWVSNLKGIAVNNLGVEYYLHVVDK